MTKKYVFHVTRLGEGQVVETNAEPKSLLFYYEASTQSYVWAYLDEAPPGYVTDRKIEKKWR